MIRRKRGTARCGPGTDETARGQTGDKPGGTTGQPETTGTTGDGDNRGTTGGQPGQPGDNRGQPGTVSVIPEFPRGLRELRILSLVCPTGLSYMRGGDAPIRAATVRERLPPSASAPLRSRL